MARCRCRWLFHGCVPTNTVIRDEQRERDEMEEFFRLVEIYSNSNTFDLKKKRIFPFSGAAWPSEKFEKMGSPLGMIHENRGYSLR